MTARQDSGRVIILDRRLATKRYGKSLRGAKEAAWRKRVGLLGMVRRTALYDVYAALEAWDTVVTCVLEQHNSQPARRDRKTIDQINKLFER